MIILVRFGNRVGIPDTRRNAPRRAGAATFPLARAFGITRRILFHRVRVPDQLGVLFLSTSTTDLTDLLMTVA